MEQDNTKIITIVGDSLCQVSSDQKIFYKETYPFLLQKMFDANEYIVKLSSRSTNQVIKQSSSDNLNTDVLFNGSEYVIIHLGIVDCAPRLFGYIEDRIVFVLSHIPVIKILVGLVIKFKSKYRRFFTKNFPKTYVTRKIFKDRYSFIIKEIKEKAKPKKIFIINIADTSERNKERSFNFEKNISDYNQILKNIYLENKDSCELIDFYSETLNNKKLIVEDEGIHLTREGHLHLAGLLHERINKIIKNSI